MSQSNAKRALLAVMRKNTDLTRSIVAGGIFLVFCYFIWNRFYRKVDPCVQLSESICLATKTTIPSCIVQSQQETSFQTRCDDVDEDNSTCQEIEAGIQKAKALCETDLVNNKTCALARKSLALDRGASDRSCTHALETMRGLLNR